MSSILPKIPKEAKSLWKARGRSVGSYTSPPQEIKQHFLQGRPTECTWQTEIPLQRAVRTRLRNPEAPVLFRGERSSFAPSWDQFNYLHQRGSTAWILERMMRFGQKYHSRYLYSPVGLIQLFPHNAAVRKRVEGRGKRIRHWNKETPEFNLDFSHNAVLQGTSVSRRTGLAVRRVLMCKSSSQWSATESETSLRDWGRKSETRREKRVAAYSSVTLMVTGGGHAHPELQLRSTTHPHPVAVFALNRR